MNHAMTRAELTEKILQIRIDRDLTWKWIAEQAGGAVVIRLSLLTRTRVSLDA